MYIYIYCIVYVFNQSEINFQQQQNKYSAVCDQCLQKIISYKHFHVIRRHGSV